MKIAVTGGTGFVGGHAAVALVEARHHVVAISRGEDRRPWAMHVRQLRGIELRALSLDNELALVDAFAGCDAVLHCAGINQQRGGRTFQTVHVRGTANAVRAAETARVSKFVHISFLRARPNCHSAYHETKWEAEEIVRASNLDWTVLKPGIMYGRGDHMVDHLTRALATFPVFFGMQRRLRPLAVADAVMVMKACLSDQRLTRKTVALTGPTELQFDDAVRLVAGLLRKRPLIVDPPLLVTYCLAWLAERFMRTPLISVAQVRMLDEGLVDPARAPDRLPLDLQPSTPFEGESVRAAMPKSEPFGFADLLLPRGIRLRRND